MKIEWVEDFKIKVIARNNEIVLSANREGLLSLAENLKLLAEEEGRSHFHLDEYNSLEEGSVELIVEKTE